MTAVVVIHNAFLNGIAAALLTGLEGIVALMGAAIIVGLAYLWYQS